MFTFRVLIACSTSLGFCAASAIAQPLRTWLDVSGRYKVEASFEGLVEELDGGKTVQLKKGDGTVIAVPIEKLTTQDRSYARRMAALKEWVVVEQRFNDKLKRFDAAERARQLPAALALFGEPTEGGGSGPDLNTFLAATQILKRHLAKGEIPRGWTTAAHDAAAQYAGKKVQLTLKTTKQPSLREVRAILGIEDRIEYEEDCSMVWYVYEWCHFGVDERNVVTLRADCDSIHE